MNFDIESIKRKMLVKYPFFGSVVANVNYKENREIQTAGTDGQIIYYNPEFLGKLKSDEQAFIFAHEVCHIAFDHIRRSEGKDPRVWNIATDGVINQFLKRDGMKLIKGCIDISDAINYDAEQLYEKLLKEKQQKQKPKEKNSLFSKPGEGEQQNENQSRGQGLSSSKPEQQRQEQNSSDGSNSLDRQNEDVGHDTHGMWEDAIKRQKEAESKVKGEEQKQQEERLQQEKDKISEMGEQRAFNKNLVEKRKELERLKQTLSQQAMGSQSDGRGRIINDIGKSNPIIDWRYVLRKTIQYDVDWSYKNAYVEDGVVRATLEEQPRVETEILLDTSGSVNELLLKNFLRECKNILQYSKVKVGCFDTEFYGFHEIRTEEDIDNMKFEGGGGTNFNVAVQAFTRRVENKIIFTDGTSSMPDIPMDAIWIVFGGAEIHPKGGKVIQISKEQLNKMCSYEQDISYKGKSR